MAHCVLDIYGVSEYPAESGTLFPVGGVLGAINKIYARVSRLQTNMSSSALTVHCLEEHKHFKGTRLTIV